MQKVKDMYERIGIVFNRTLYVVSVFSPLMWNVDVNGYGHVNYIGMDYLKQNKDIKLLYELCFYSILKQSYIYKKVISFSDMKGGRLCVINV